MKSYIVLLVCLDIVVSAYSSSLSGITSEKSSSSNTTLHRGLKEDKCTHSSPTTCPACHEKVNDTLLKDICHHVYTDMFIASIGVVDSSALFDISNVIMSAEQLAKQYNFRFRRECEGKCPYLSFDKNEFFIFLKDGASIKDCCITMDNKAVIMKFSVPNF